MYSAPRTWTEHKNGCQYVPLSIKNIFGLCIQTVQSKYKIKQPNKSLEAKSLVSLDMIDMKTQTLTWLF